MKEAFANNTFKHFKLLTSNILAFFILFSTAVFRHSAFTLLTWNSERLLKTEEKHRLWARHRCTGHERPLTHEQTRRHKHTRRRCRERKREREIAIENVRVREGDFSMWRHATSVTRWLYYLFNIWLLTAIIIFPIP